MGFLSNKCSNPDCNHRVRKGSKFCPKCGGNAPKGVVNCGTCNKEVRTSSKFCWNCGTELAVVTPPVFTQNRWARTPEDFAVRVDVDDIKSWLVKPLIVEHGTRALLFQKGKFKGELEAGRYDVGGFAARIANFLIDRAASVVIMDAGDAPLDLENVGLWTEDKFEIGTTARLIIQVEHPEALFVNLIKGRTHVTIDDLECTLAGEVQMLLSGIVARYRADQLFSSLDARYEIEAALRENLATTMQRLGLRLIQLRFIDFVGEAFEELRRKAGDLQVDLKDADLRTQRYHLQQRLREALTEEKMHEFKTEKDLEDFLRQTEHELGLKDVIRDDEMKRLTARFEFERDREHLLRRLEIEAIKNDDRREEAWKELIAEERRRDEIHNRALERRLAEGKNEAELRRIKLELDRLEHEEDERQAEVGIRLLRKTKEIEWDEDRLEVELEGQTLEQRSKATVEALMSIVDGPAAERLGELEQLRVRQNMSPEQILALAAEASPAAAEALAKKYEAEGQLSKEVKEQLEARISEQREIAGEHADRIERLTQTALAQMGGVAATRAQPIPPGSQTVVAPSGHGHPTVVSSSPVHVHCCCHCNHTLERGAVFCTECGKKQE